MATQGLRRDERIGLLAAVALHAAVLGALYLDPHSDQVVEPPQRIEVTISDDVGLTSTAPDPYSEAAADVAPTIGEEPPVPEPEPSPLPPEPAPRAIEPTRPKPQPKKPPPKETSSARRKSAIDDIVSKPAPKTGGSRIGSDFLEGVQGAQATQGKGTPAQAAGPKVQSSLLGSISRQLNPYWQGKVPEGADSEKLVTILRWNLNRDGSLSGTPQVVRQEGITDANRPQAGRHAEQAIRAVQLAAPFNLPPEYYDTWKRVTIRFDKRLSQ